MGADRDGDSAPLRNRVLDHDLLRAFVAVVDCGGFTAAANVLHRTQAAVSLQIKRLEEAVSVALLQHPRRTVQLTHEGQLLVEYARRMLALNDEALSAVRSDEVSGRIRLGANNYFATVVLPPLLARFWKAHPEVQIELHTGVSADMETRLGSTYDLTINVYPKGGGEGELVMEQEPLWVTARQDSPDAFSPLPLALLPRGSLFREWAIGALAERKRPWRIVHESTNIAAMEAVVVAGLAVSVFQRLSVDFDRLRQLTPAEGFPALPRADVRLCAAERYLPRAATRLYEFLLSELRLPTR
jgi:DNA-binding transcriptional LysR family regulator